jgi:type IV pilus assembly protein PilO
MAAGMNRLSKRTQLIVLGVLILLLCGIYYVYLISPLNSELQTVNLDIERLTREIEEGQRLLPQLQELKESVRLEEIRLYNLQQILPDRKETAQIIRQVHDLAVSSKLQIKSFTPRRTVDHGFYEDWPILLSIDGTYNNLGDFFERIAGFTRLINIDDLSIQAIEEGATDRRTLSATCTATTFVFAGGAPPPGPTAVSQGAAP